MGMPEAHNFGFSLFVENECLLAKGIVSYQLKSVPHMQNRFRFILDFH